MNNARRALILLVAAMPVMAADADLILYGGKIMTADRTFSIKEAVAIRDGKIVDLGLTANIFSRNRGPKTRMINLKGHTVLPGLIDSHVHALSAGLSEYRRPLPQLHSFSDIQHFLREQTAMVPKGQWIVVP